MSYGGTLCMCQQVFANVQRARREFLTSNVHTRRQPLTARRVVSIRYAHRYSRQAWQFAPNIATSSAYPMHKQLYRTVPRPELFESAMSTASIQG